MRERHNASAWSPSERFVQGTQHPDPVSVEMERLTTYRAVIWNAAMVMLCTVAVFAVFIYIARG